MIFNISALCLVVNTMEFEKFLFTDKHQSFCFAIVRLYILYVLPIYTYGCQAIEKIPRGTLVFFFQRPGHFYICKKKNKFYFLN